jgi:hypothetical protein
MKLSRGLLLFSILGWLSGCTRQGRSGVLDGLEPRQGETRYTLDNLNDQPFVAGVPVVLDSKQDRDWILWGWAIDAPANKPAGGVVLILDGKTELPAKYGVERQDIAVALGNPEYAHSGYQAHLKSGDLSKGHHTAAVVIITADRRGYYRPKAEWSFTVR